MLRLPVPEAQYKNVVLKPSEYQKEIVQSLAERAETVRNNLVESSEDNVIKITNNVRKLALDQRLVNDMLPDNEKKKYHKTKINGKAYFPKVNFVRSADDFIVTGESREILEKGVLPIIREFLSERGLELSEEKTAITHIEDGFDFLGSNIRWYKDKLLTKPSKKNCKAKVGKAREIIKRNPSMKQEDLIRKLNQVIRCVPAKI